MDQPFSTLLQDFLRQEAGEDDLLGPAEGKSSLFI